MALTYQYDKITGFSHPALYPDKKSPDWVIPEEIKSEHSRLNTIIETKYTREYLKICAFYNKMFPSLKSYSWTTASYNVPAFTVTDQERNDTGTGISSNYLKKIVDDIVSRLGTIPFEAKVHTDMPTLEYIMYKEETERLLKKHANSSNLTQLSLEAFHNAAILGYSHCFIDPYTHSVTKASDFEIGLFEPQFNKGKIRQMLYRDYAFPVTELKPYLANLGNEALNEIVEQIGSKTSVDFKMYFDCTTRKVYVTINNRTLPEKDYPFDYVQMVTFCWDTGFSKVTSTSMFDLLYPVQREVNKVNAKIQQLIRLYKGPVPVFNGDVDLAMRSISNGTGEALYVDSSRPVDSLMTIINPTPLDAALTSEKTNLKTEMYELAGVQQMSFDMENLRSAASIIAIDQTRDIVFQAQLGGIAKYVKDIFEMIVHYNSVTKQDDTVDWEVINKLIIDCDVSVQPVTSNDPRNSTIDSEVDYRQIQCAKYTMGIIKNEIQFVEIPFYVNKEIVKKMLADTIVRLDAFNIEVPECVMVSLAQAFIEDVDAGLISLLDEGVMPNG